MGAGSLVISLDFELHWGRFDKVDLFKCEKYYWETHRAVPEILRLFSDFEIRATWAAVGMLFAKNAEEWQQYMPAELPGYDDPVHSPYQWFLSADFPEHCLFAPDLVAAIAVSPGQELGSHTFSHYHTNEPGQTIPRRPPRRPEDSRGQVRTGAGLPGISS